MLAITPQASPWKFKQTAGGPAVEVSRTQLPVLPPKYGTLHSVQGKTADPGLILHWTFPLGLSKESLWLAYDVSLSRPRSFDQLLSHVMPCTTSVFTRSVPDLVRRSRVGRGRPNGTATSNNCITMLSEQGAALLPLPLSI